MSIQLQIQHATEVRARTKAHHTDAPGHRPFGTLELSITDVNGNEHLIVVYRNDDATASPRIALDAESPPVVAWPRTANGVYAGLVDARDQTAEILAESTDHHILPSDAGRIYDILDDAIGFLSRAMDSRRARAASAPGHIAATDLTDRTIPVGSLTDPANLEAAIRADLIAAGNRGDVRRAKQLSDELDRIEGERDGLKVARPVQAGEIL